MRRLMSRILYFSPVTDQPVTVGETLRVIPLAALAFALMWLMCAWAVV